MWRRDAQNSPTLIGRFARHFVQLDEPEQVARLILAMPGRRVRQADAVTKSVTPIAG